MGRQDELKWVDNLLMDWADFVVRLEQSPLGYPGQSVDERAMRPDNLTGSIKGSKVPNVFMNVRISNCDMAVKYLKERKPTLAEVLHYRYIIPGHDEGEKARRYMADTGITCKSTWHKRLKRAQRAVADWIWRYGRTE